jgi:hypothetical protein
MLRGGALTGQADQQQERCALMPAEIAEFTTALRKIAGHAANRVMTGPPVLIRAGNRNHPSPKVLG